MQNWRQHNLAERDHRNVITGENFAKPGDYKATTGGEGCEECCPKAFLVFVGGSGLRRIYESRLCLRTVTVN
jgi:mRNA-degrading endonuclease HigB of HigAB toxin-antitoxin module